MQQSETSAMKRTSLNAWNLSLGRAICGDVQAGLEREWLVTNGLGGYAAGSLLGATTRSYHGLLVAALRPPIERWVLVTKVDEELRLPQGTVLKLGSTSTTMAPLIHRECRTSTASVSKATFPAFVIAWGPLSF